MNTLRGPAIFLAQFMDDSPPFNSLDSICQWAANLGYKGIQIPTWESRLIDLEKAAENQTYCDELKGKITDYGLEITELSTHLQGQLVAVHPAYDVMFDTFAPDEVKGNPKARTDWAIRTVKNGLKASERLGIKSHATFSGALLWHTFHPWPQRPPGLVEMGFKELAKRWLPILNVAEECGVDVCYEIHPGEDLHDGVTFERFLKETGNHKRCNILYDPSHFVIGNLDYLAYIDHYHEFIKAFHVKGAEYRYNGKSGAWGGYQDWKDRAGRYRHPGDGDIDWTNVFTKLTEHGCPVWAVLEWECCVKSPEQGALEGAEFINHHIIEATAKAFDDFASGESDDATNRKILGL